MNQAKLFTIGFTKKSAETFFNKLRTAGVKRLIDVRLNNVSQLAGFAKRDDLDYFLKVICDCEYRHEPLLAPTKEILAGYKKKEMEWEEYETRFVKLLENRQAHHLVTPDELRNSCLLCSEPKPDKCHRRLVAEFLRSRFDGIEIYHL